MASHAAMTIAHVWSNMCVHCASSCLMIVTTKSCTFSTILDFSRRNFLAHHHEIVGYRFRHGQVVAIVFVRPDELSHPLRNTSLPTTPEFDTITIITEVAWLTFPLLARFRHAFHLRIPISQYYVRIYPVQVYDTTSIGHFPPNSSPCTPIINFSSASPF